MYTEDDCVSTNTLSQPKKELNVLSQKELMQWWPFTRLDPKRFPKQPKRDPLEDTEEALL
jgi:hypothetical protein